jgi:hypothetical protein
MTASQDVPKRIPGIKTTWRIHGAAVIALWGIFAAWVVIEALWPSHRTESVLWRNGITLMCCSAAACATVAWYLTRALIEPMNDYLVAFRMGYKAGYADGQTERRIPDLHLVSAPPHTRNGTH